MGTRLVSFVPVDVSGPSRYGDYAINNSGTTVALLKSISRWPLSTLYHQQSYEYFSFHASHPITTPFLPGEKASSSASAHIIHHPQKQFPH